MEKGTKLLLFQIDLADGTDIGNVIESLYSWGAAQVQVITTITRHNHPAYLVLVDIGSMREASFATELATEFSISAYYRLESILHQLPARQIERELTVQCNGGELKMMLHIRQVGEANPQPAPPLPALVLLAAIAPPEVLEPPGSQNITTLLNNRVSRDDLRQLKNQIQKMFGIRISLVTLQQQIDTLLSSNVPFVITLNKPKK